MNKAGINKTTFTIVAVVLAVVVFFITIAFMGGSAESGGRATVSFFGPAGATVYIGEMDEDNNVVPRETVETTQSETEVELDPGSATFVVSRGDGFYPWEKTLELAEGSETSLYPLLLPREVELESVDESAVLDAFETPATLPTSDAPLQATEEGDGLEAYVDGQALMVGWNGDVADMPEFFCPGENVSDCLVQQTFSFEQTGQIEHIAFFGPEHQFLLFDRGTTIAVIEIDRRSTQNYQPLYEGTNPAFRMIDGDIYISDGADLWRASLPAYTQ